MQDWPYDSDQTQRLARFAVRSMEATGGQLLPGQLPPGVDLPLDPTWDILASHRAPGGGAMVLVECPTSASEALPLLKTRLRDAGWAEAPSPFSGFPGFTPSGDNPIFRRQGRQLHVDSFRTCLRLTVFPEFPAMQHPEFDQEPGDHGGQSVMTSRFVGMGAPSHAPRHLPPRQGPLPELQLPPGAEFRGGGSGGSGTDWEAHLDARTDLSAAELELHFEGQLQKRGWQRVEAGAAGPCAWSLWRVGEAAATLTVVQGASRQRSAYLQFNGGED